MNTDPNLVGSARFRRQRGATALEFALVFPVFFALFYAILHFGMISATRLNLQHAAEEGAREALRWRGADIAIADCLNGEPPETDPVQLRLRADCAEHVARVQTQWLNRWSEPEINAVICLSDQICPAAQGAIPACGSDAGSRCQIVVTVSYPYGTQPLLPALPGFGLLAPNAIRGQARVMLDGRML